MFIWKCIPPFPLWLPFSLTPHKAALYINRLRWKCRGFPGRKKWEAAYIKGRCRLASVFQSLVVQLRVVRRICCNPQPTFKIISADSLVRMPPPKPGSAPKDCVTMDNWLQLSTHFLTWKVEVITVSISWSCLKIKQFNIISLWEVPAIVSTHCYSPSRNSLGQELKAYRAYAEHDFESRSSSHWT